MKAKRKVILTETIRVKNEPVVMIEELFTKITDKIEIKLSYIPLVNFVLETPNKVIIGAKGERLMLSKDDAETIMHLLKEE